MQMYMYDEIMEQPDVLNRCLETNKSVIEQIVNNIRETDINNIIIAARGTSDHAAIYAKYCLEIKTGLPVSLAAPSVITLYSGKMDYRRSLVIGISQSGMAEDVRCVLNSAKEQGALTVACTNNEGSPVASQARYHLFTNAGEEKSVAATKTFLSQMYVLSLFAAIWCDDAVMQNGLYGLPDILKKQLLTRDNIDAIFEESRIYSVIDSCFVLARGLLYPMALEAALKMQETSYIHAHGYAISDFWHGPLAMVKQGTPVVLFGSHDEALSDEIRIAGKLRELGAQILIITDTERLRIYADRSITIPRLAYMESAFVHAVTAQLFAYGIAIAKGLSPDKPRSLKKVTITK
jgi:glucosamine--fructose-6-phosphate aminotransferase (isomerizing)